MQLLEFDLTTIFGLIPAMVVRGWVWQLVTYMFLHGQGLSHLLFNLLFLWLFGSELERIWGGRAFVKYYFISGIGAGVFAVILGMFTDAGYVRTVGASGAIFGLLIAYGTVFAERTILFMLIFPMKARTFAWIMFGIAFFSTWDQSGSGVSHIAHLGGAVTGFLYLKRAWRVVPFLSELRWKLRRRRFRVMDRHDDDFPYH